MERLPAKRWLAVGLWILLILTAIPFVRRLTEYFAARWPIELLGGAVMLVMAAATVWALALLRRRLGRLRAMDVLSLGGISVVFIVWATQLTESPQETVHFVEYGVLAVLLHRALRLHIADSGVFLIGAAIGMLVGTFDEIVQWVVPGRQWDFRDLVLNGGTSGLVQLALWRLSPAQEKGFSLESVRLLGRITATQVLLLTLCFSTTPQRVGAIAGRFPVFAGLATGDDVICEYGHMHRLDDTTRFRSRLTRGELEQQDRERFLEVASILDRSRQRYNEFLRSTSPAVDAFAYEARVHVFARNKNLARGRKLATDSADRRRFMTIAARENRILEQVFGRALGESVFRWNPRQRRLAQSAEDPEADFVSRVGGHLITAISEKRLRLVMLALLAGLVILDRGIGRAIRSRAPATAE
jgi:hypothetical protein